VKQGVKNMIEEQLYFKVDFEGFTRIVRDFWAEGRYLFTLGILTDCGIGSKDAANIIRGKVKMVQDPDGKEGVVGMLAKDDWQPSPGLHYPDPSDVAQVEIENARYRQMYFDMAISMVKEMLHKRDKALKTDNGRLISDIDDYLSTVPDEVFEKGGLKRPPSYSWVDWDDAETKLDGFIKRMKVLDSKPAPKPDHTYQARTGWLLPDGRYYPCEWFEHEWAANILGVNGSSGAEKAGWVKITHAMDNEDELHVLFFGNELTQAQIDGLWEWGKANDRVELVRRLIEDGSL
jgi:hypothetical protein